MNVLYCTEMGPRIGSMWWGGVYPGKHLCLVRQARADMVTDKRMTTKKIIKLVLCIWDA